MLKSAQYYLTIKKLIFFNDFFYFITGECMDEMEEADCAKVVKKDQCEKKGDKCKKSCDMCEGAAERSFWGR